MKKMIMLLSLILIPTLALAQTHLEEDFSGDWPPTGWSADSHSSNWYNGDTDNAGGTSPEGIFGWSPQFSGTTYFISPEIDLTDVTLLYFEFKHFIDHYSGSYTVGVATRSGGGSWNTVWSEANPSGNVGPETVTQQISNDDVGASDFQISFFFTGSSYNIDYWYFDDFLLYTPLDHDMKMADIVIDDQYESGDNISPAATVQNFGLNEEIFDVNCEIFLGGTSVYSETIEDVDFEAGEQATITFPAYSIVDANALFYVTATVILDGDMNESNDSKSDYFNTYTTARDMVMLEIGTGTWCQYCPGAAMGAEDLIDNGLNVAVVEYHSGSSDPYENDEGLERVDYYGISGYPTAVFDGVSKVIGGSNDQSMYSYYLPEVQERAAINTAFTIELFGQNDDYDYDIVARVTKMAEIPYTNMVVQVALTESDISYSWQGQTHLEWVERDMIETADGTQIEFSGGDVQDINLAFTLDSGWELANCELAAWVQNNSNKEVLQATKVMLTDLTPVAIDDEIVSLPLETSLGDNYPNPFNPSTKFDYSLSSPGEVTLEVFNIMGQKVKTIVDDYLNAGYHYAVWDGTDESGAGVSSGMYFYKLSTGDFTETKKMVLMK